MPNDENYITESYLRRQIEVGHIFPNILDALQRIICPPGFHFQTDSDDWFDKGTITATTKSHDYLKPYLSPVKIGITITNRFYTPGGTITRGAPTPTQSAGPLCTGQYSTIRNHGKNPDDHKIDKTVTLTDSQESSLERGFTLDITAKQSVGYAGVTAELEEHLGIEEKSTVTTSHTKETSTTFSDETSVDPGDEIAIVYSQTPRQWTEPYDVDALCDIAFDLHIHNLGYFSTQYRDHHGLHRPGAPILFSKHNKDLWYGTQDNTKKFPWNVKGNQTWNAKFKSIHHFLGMLKGYDPRAPHMRYLPEGLKSSKPVQALENPKTLRLQLKGVADIATQSDADYSITDITGLTDTQVGDAYAVGNPAPQ